MLELERQDSLNSEVNQSEQEIYIAKLESLKEKKGNPLWIEVLSALLELGFTNFEKNIDLCMKHKC